MLLALEVFKKIVNKFQKHSLNFHPSPLPKDRGWYPHVHQIRNNNDSGVTLHVIDEKLDSGEIWKQKNKAQLSTNCRRSSRGFEDRNY